MKNWFQEAFSIRFKWTDGEFSFHIGTMWIVAIVAWVIL